MTQPTKPIVSPFKSTHQLDFESGAYPRKLPDGHNWQGFRVGTCTGLWCSEGNVYLILVIVNSEPGNGHLIDVLDWFKNSCKRDQKNLKMLEVWNDNFKQNLISKHGFEPSGSMDLIWTVPDQKSHLKICKTAE